MYAVHAFFYVLWAVKFACSCVTPFPLVNNLPCLFLHLAGGAHGVGGWSHCHGMRTMSGP